jgi:hypothetical protein
MRPSRARWQSAGVRRWPLLLLAAVTACAGEGRCPQIGCVSALTVELPPEAASARACVGEVCTDAVREGQLEVPLSRRDEGSSVDLVVELVDPAGTSTTFRGDVPVQRARPNGEGCPPVCVTGKARVDPARGGIVA